MNPTDPTQNPQAPVVDPNQQPAAGMPATPAEPTVPATPSETPAMPEPTVPATPSETPAEGQEPGGTGTPPVVPPVTA